MPKVQPMEPGPERDAAVMVLLSKAELSARNAREIAVMQLEAAQRAKGVQLARPGELHNGMRIGPSEDVAAAQQLGAMGTKAMMDLVLSATELALRLGIEVQVGEG